LRLSSPGKLRVRCRFSPLNFVHAQYLYEPVLVGASTAPARYYTGHQKSNPSHERRKNSETLLPKMLSIQKIRNLECGSYYGCRSWVTNFSFLFSFF